MTDGKLDKAGSFLRSATDGLNRLKKKLDLSSIVQHDFVAREYIKKVYAKNQITGHHTASGESVNGDITWWLNDGKRIGTCILIARDGTIHQVFSSKFSAYHLGENGTDHKSLGLAYQRNDFRTIGVEVDSWGGLTFDSSIDHWRSWTGAIINDEDVQIYPEKYRGYYAFEKYTPEQIESYRQLLVFWGDLYDIPLQYNSAMWELNKRALSGKSGVYTHASYRLDKSDMHPQPELITMHKELTPETL